MSNFWEAAPIAGQQPQQPQTPPPQPAANFWEDAPVAGQPAAAPAPAPTPAPVPSIVPAVNPAAIRQDTSGAALVAPGSVPGNDGYGDEAAALGYGTARSIAPAFAGGAAAAGIGGLLTATGVGAPVGIPLTILGAFGAGYGTRVAQDKLIEPSEYEKQVAAQHPTLYNTIPAVATMPLGGGRFGVQNIKDLGTAVSAARAGRVLTEAEKAAAIAAGTQVGVNVAIPAATRTYNVSQGQEFGLGDFLIEAGAAPFVGGKSYRPVEIVQNVAQTAGFKAGDAMRRGARTAGQTVGATARPTAAGEVNQPVTQFNGVDLVMPEGFNPIIWGRLTDEGRFNAIKDFEARAAAEAAQAQAAAPQPAPMAPPRPEQGTLPVPPAAEAPAPTPVAEPQRPATVEPQDLDGLDPKTVERLLADEARQAAAAQAQKPAAPPTQPTPEIVPQGTETLASIAAEVRGKDAEIQANLDRVAEQNRLAREAELRANETEPKLPRDLAGGRARFGFGDKNVELNFASDLDKAAFIVSQATKNKRHDDYIRWAMDKFGMTEAEVLAHGQRVRSSIKEVVRNTDGPLAQISRVERATQTAKPSTAAETQGAPASPITKPAADYAGNTAADDAKLSAEIIAYEKGPIARIIAEISALEKKGDPASLQRAKDLGRQVDAWNEQSMEVMTGVGQRATARNAGQSKPQQTEIAGTEDAFNLTPEETRAPAPEKPADTTADALPDAQEPAYVSEARRDLAALEAQGKGNTAKAKAIRNVIEEYVEKKNNPNIDYRGGEKIEFNGKTQQIAGGTFFEFVYLTGPKKGQIGVTQTPPRKPAATGAAPSKLEATAPKPAAAETPAPKPVEPAAETNPAEDFDPAEDAPRPGEDPQARAELEAAWAEEDAARPETSPVDREIARLEGLKGSAEDQLARLEKSGKGDGKQAQKLRKTIEGLRQDIAEQNANRRIKDADKEDSGDMDFPTPAQRRQPTADAAGNLTGPELRPVEPPVEVGGQARPVGSRELPATPEKPATAESTTAKPAEGGANESDGLRFARGRKARAEKRLDELLKSGSGEDDPRVQAARRNIESLNKRIKAEEKKQRDASKPRDIEAEIEAKKEQIRQKENQIARALEVEDMKGQDVAGGDEGAEKAYRLAEAQVERRNKEMAQLKKELANLEGEAKNLPDKNTPEPDQAAEPVDVKRARKYIEQQSKNERPASRQKLQEAKDVVEQYELDELARAPGNKLGDLEMEGVSDETLTDIADGYNSREDAGDTLSPDEALHKQKVEKELMRRFETDARDTSGELDDNRLLLEQGAAAIGKGRYLPRLPRQYGADQIAGYLGSVSKRLQRRLFRNPPGVKIKKNPTPEEIEAARRAADSMIADWHESAGQNNETFDPSSTNSDEAVRAFLEAADAEGGIQESGSVPRRYKTLAEDMDAEGQPPVRETDEAMPDVDVDPETGATIRTEEVDPAEAALAGRDETPPGVMPSHLDDGQGGRTLQPDANGEGGIVDRLDKAADDILGPESEGRLHSPTPSVITAMVWRTARAMQKGAVDAAKGFKSWSSQFVRTYGSAFKSYAQYIWDAAKNTSQKMFVNFKPRALAGISEKANQIADRNEQSPAAKEVAAIIFNRPGARTAGQGMGAPMRIESAQARVRNRLAELAMQFRDKIGQMTDAERAMFNKLCRRIHEGNAPMPKGWVGDFVRGMRDILRNDPDAGLLAQQNAGVDIGDVGETYFPRNLDSNMVKAREGEFIKAATEAYKRLWNRLTEAKRLELFPELGTDPATRQGVNDAFFEAKAREYYNRVTEQITDGDLLPMFEGAEGTKARVTKERVFNNDEASLFDEFYTNDYLGDIERYLASAARRKVTAEAIGPNGEKLADLSQRMSAEGVSPDDRREMRDLLKIALGIGRKSDDQMTAAYFDATGFVQGAVMLGRSFWNNLIQEPMQIGVRASTKPLGVDAPINILRAYKDTYTNFARDYMRLNPEQARRFRQATGKDPAFSKNLDEILSEELGLNGLNDPSFYAETSGDFGRDAKGLPGLRRLTGKIFDLNLLSPTEAAKVTASVSAARRFLADNLRFAAGESKLQKLFQGVGIDIGGRKTAKLYLAELGIKESEIQPMLAVIDAIDAAQKSGGTDAVIQLISGNDPWAVRYREALGTFSRQSSVKPSRATKPTFQDEGLGRMFLQLKGFSYDFEQSINLRRWGLMKEAVTGKNWGLYDRAVMAGPLLGMPLTVAATAGKFALMNMLYPSEGSERRKREPVAMKGLDAASYEGVFGPFFEALFKTQRQQTPMGGAVGQVVMDVSKAGVNAVATDSNTNAPERQVSRTGYRNVVKPAIAAASTILPRPLGTAVNLGLGATQPEDAFVDETAGERGERDKKQRGW